MVDFINSFFRETTTKRLFFSLGCLALLVYFVPTAYLFRINQSEYKRIEENYSRTVLKAIEGGALKFARMHAIAIANEQLDELVTSINESGIFIVTAYIRSGPDLNEIVARSDGNAIQDIPESCLVKYQTEKRFEDAVYSFLIQLTVNRCEFQGQTSTQLLGLMLSGIAIVSGFILLLLLAVRPVQRSLTTLLSIAGEAPPQGKFELSQIPFLPIRSIASVFLEAQTLRRDAAIARTTQMLAHDVRKPFNLFRMTMDRVNAAQSPEQKSVVLNEALPEVDRALASVNGLIADVLNVGDGNKLDLKPVRLAQVIEEVTDEVRRLYPKRLLKIDNKISSDVWIQADLTRLPRVFMNILSNAIEAVESNEVTLWISTQALEWNPSAADRRIEVRVGNEGSFISPEARERIFDLFFTSGKSGGTGLGLAIVKKIVTQHGGSVVCTSERSKAFPRGKVEFLIQLMAASPAEVSKEETTNTSKIAETEDEVSQTTAQSPALQATLPYEEKPHVVFLDDSPLARWVWEAKLKPCTNIHCFAGPRELFEGIESGSIALSKIHTLITDHYFAPDERLTGLDVARELRTRGFEGRILLASNGAFSAAELTGLVDKVVDKSPVDWDELGH